MTEQMITYFPCTARNTQTGKL